MNHRAKPLSNELEQSAQWHGDETAIRELGADRTVTYRELDERANAIGDALHERGVREKDRVAIVLYNTVEFPEVLFACHKRGFIPVAINGRFGADTFTYVFEQLNPAAIVYDAALGDVAEAATDAETNSEMVVVADDLDQTHDADVTVRALREAGSVSSPPRPLVSKDEVSYMFYTSGTTGRPKAVAHSIRSARERTDTAIETSGISSESTSLLLLPLFHGGGLDVTLRPAVATGAELLIGRDIDDEMALDAIEAYDVTDVRSVATQMQRFSIRDDVGERDLSSVEAWRHSGGILTESDARTFRETLTQNIYNAYGSSEGGTNSILRPDDLPIHAGTVGRPTVGDTIRVVEHDTDREASPDDTVDAGELGEVIVESEQSFCGYYEHEGSHGRGPDDWYYTNDLGRVEDGYLRIEGRADDMIISGGELISAAEVEDVLEGRSDVAGCVVVGVPDDEWGERVEAYVEADDDVDATTLEEFCKGASALADYKRPRSYEFVDRIRRNEMGKKNREYYR